MEVFQAIERRRSIRKYRHLDVPPQHLKRILEAGRLAPSSGNRQPWRFIVVRSPERKKALAKAAWKQTFLADAGAIVVGLADSGASPKWFKLDAMIAIENMVLASTSLGYGTCWIGGFEEEEVKELLGVPEGIAVVALFPIGVPDEKPAPKPRKDFGEIFFEEEYGQPLTM